ncbi:MULTISPECIES: serine/threonine-protein kinase [Streptomyces]|uniref:Serine/threonine-protein kinase n=1 Tax=Streptomyces solicathayae TaxID=3081768 RepID=A0ABZ0LP62_9ACTN|nr:serine/threonine-protein kinase [Streptomyces sp. HUAS YS2]WOX21289.1 serine/threonine-protein kinase [Streptomyces sp. HUAS YS2]
MSAQLPGEQPAQTALSSDDPSEIGGYRLHARLGAGGMGVVYLAYTPGGRPIALKVVRQEFAADPEFRERFAQEVASARRIHGLFTAQVVDFGVDARTPWLATAYVPGPTLQQVVRRHGPLPVRTVLLLVAGIAEALQGIHGVGVVHRDLKPANVLMASDGPKVIDFGISRAADAAALTGTGLRIGTAAFMAPEQALGLRATAATDVFALGALAVYVAGGAPPFGDGPESAALYRVVHEQPDLARVPVELRDLLGRCLAKRPEDRPTTAELIAAVHAHPVVGGRPEFAEGWLPHQVSDEIARHDAGRAPTHVHATATATAAVAATATATAVPSPYGRTGDEGAAAPVGFGGVAPADGPGSRPGGDAGAPYPPRSRRSPRRGARAPLIVLLVFLALMVGGGAVYYFDYPPEGETESPDAGGSPSAVATATAGPSDPSSRPSGTEPARYVPGYANVELTSPDTSYEFDLRTGKVVPEDTAAWYLARSADAFVLPEESDAFIAAGDELSAADCVRGIETQPVTALPFAELSDERPFCVRSADQKELVIARLVEVAPEDGSVTIVLDRHRSAD